MTKKTESGKKERKKLRILAASDIHGDYDIAKKLAEKAKKKKVDLVVLAGDIHGMFEGGDVLAPFRKANQKVVFIPGNWDSTFEMNTLKDKPKVRNIHGYYVNYKGTDVVGIGSPDFQLSLDEKRTFNRLKKNFDKIKMKKGKKILVSHLHAAGTKAEFSGFPGSKALRKIIDKFQPDIFISAHIHEAEGIEEMIGKTRVINVGRSGKILEI